MIIKLPAKINLDNDILEIFILGKSITSIPFQNVETIRIIKTEKPISFWLYILVFFLIVIYFLYKIIEYDYFLILVPFVFIIFISFFKNLYPNSVMIKEYGCSPNEHYIYQKDITKIKIIIVKIRFRKFNK